MGIGCFTETSRSGHSKLLNHLQIRSTKYEIRRTTMSESSRRAFLKKAGALAALGSLPLSEALTSGVSRTATIPFDLGMASYTFRKFTLDQALDMTRLLDLKKITLKDMHLPMNITPPEMAVVKKKMKDAGIELSSCGVVYMKTPEEVH